MTSFHGTSSKITVLLADFRAIGEGELAAYLESQPDIDVLGQVTLNQDLLEFVRHADPDVVVVCVGDSVFGGVTAVSRVRLHHPDVKIVVVTSALSPGNLMLALEAGVHGYVLADAGNPAVAKAVRAAPVGAVYLSGAAADMLVDDYERRQGVGNSRDQLARLSKREREVFQRLVDGESATSIAGDLQLSPKTVDTYRRRMMQKLGVTSMPALVKLALKHGMTEAR